MLVCSWYVFHVSAAVLDLSRFRPLLDRGGCVILLPVSGIRRILPTVCTLSVRYLPGLSFGGMPHVLHVRRCTKYTVVKSGYSA